MLALFTVAWADLDLSAVRAFLDGTGEEGVTWEAKADDNEERRPPTGEGPGRLRPTLRTAATPGATREMQPSRRRYGTAALPASGG